MNRALRFYPWESLDIVRYLPPGHWFHRGYHFLSRTPTDAELLMRYPPFGLLHDEDWQEEMTLLTFLQRRRVRRAALTALPPLPFNRGMHLMGKPDSGRKDDQHHGKKADPPFTLQKGDQCKDRTRDINFFNYENVNRSSNHCAAMTPNDGELTRSLGRQTNADYDVAQGPSRSGSESSWSNDNAAPSQDGDMDVDEPERSESPQFSPNSPPFVPCCYTPEECSEFNSDAGTNSCSNHISSSGDDRDSDVSDIEELSQAHLQVNNAVANPMQYVIDEQLYIPRNPGETRELTRRFREEILHDWMADDRAQLGLHEPFDAHQLDMADLGTALQSGDNTLNGKLFITQTNIIRHDWIEYNEQHDCIYTIRALGRRYRGSAELLNHQLAGVRRAIWQYWESRTRVNPEYIRAYVEGHDPFGYFRAVMWHLLTPEKWIDLWQQRRTSRRALDRGGGTVM